MADFNFYLNRQGVRGNKGEQGEQGFSPYISVNTNTANEYTLDVTNESGTFTTPNLRGNAIEDEGGTYIRYNPETKGMYTGYADTASTTQQGEVTLSTPENLAAGGDGTVPTSGDVFDFVENKISEASVNYVDIEDYTQKMSELDGEIDTLDTDKLDFSDLADALTAGTNITIVPNSTTGKITISGEPVDQAQADWDEADSTEPSYIKNKPTIPASQIQSDWEQADSSALDYIKNKPVIDGELSSTSTNAVQNRLVTNAINLISNNMENLADKDLSNLTSAGNSRLHALKSYEDAGELLTDSEGLADVIKYAHSTYDNSKFTKVGSPTITDDGIAIFNSSSRLKTGYTLNPSKGQSWKIKMQWEVTAEAISGTGTADAVTNKILGNGNTTNCISLENLTRFYWLRQYLPVYDFVAETNKIFYIDFRPESHNVYKPSVGDIIDYEVWYNTTDLFKARYRINNGAWIDGVASIDSGYAPLTMSNYTLVGINPLGLGNWYDTGATDDKNRQNLKYFEVEVDDRVVFSGNRTGIDTIKPNDYTVVGTPTISADGVVSGTSTSNYVSGFDVSELKNKSFEIRGTHTITSTSFNVFYTNLSNSINTFGVKYIVGTNYKEFRFSYKWYGASAGFYTNARNGSTGENFNVGDTYEWYYKFTYPTTLNVGIRKVGTTAWITRTVTDDTYLNGLADIYNADNTTVLLLGKQTNDDSIGSIDLNPFKIYIDGSLVYQPCLKIPYTLSKTGSKVVNSIYRDRVNDMASQFGSANYYTLDEDNGNFTLPRGELYGLIENATTAIPSGVVQSPSITNIVSLTQAEYDLIVPESDTLYIITPSS